MRLWTRRQRVLSGTAAALGVALAITPPNAEAWERYNDGCQNCHGSFTGSTSPQGTVFPEDDKHAMHRGAAFMATDCDLCHLAGDGWNPFLDESNGTANNPGVGCVGCHGRDYGGSVGHSGVGLRAHHAVNGITSCAPCHSGDPTPLPENIQPVYYGTVDTNVDDSCNSGPAFLENWSIGDTLGLDNDGDDVYDSADSDAGTWYLDSDGDGFGDSGQSQISCEQPTGYVDVDGDCDDADDTVFPGAPEECDGKDNDCDGQTDEETPVWHQDSDGDGFGDPDVSQEDCVQPAGFVFDSTDCDDADATVFPGATELCDGLDNDCDGSVPSAEGDDDGDGVLNCDDNCPSASNPDQADADGDGVGDACETGDPPSDGDDDDDDDMDDDGETDDDDNDGDDGPNDDDSNNDESTGEADQSTALLALLSALLCGFGVFPAVGFTSFGLVAWKIVRRRRRKS